MCEGSSRKEEKQAERFGEEEKEEEFVKRCRGAKCPTLAWM